MKNLNNLLFEKLHLNKDFGYDDIELTPNAKRSLQKLVNTFHDTFEIYCDEVGPDDFGPDDFYITLFENFFDKLLKDKDYYIQSSLKYWFENHKDDLEFESDD